MQSKAKHAKFYLTSDKSSAKNSSQWLFNDTVVMYTSDDGDSRWGNDGRSIWPVFWLICDLDHWLYTVVFVWQLGWSKHALNLQYVFVGGVGWGVDGGWGRDTLLEMTHLTFCHEPCFIGGQLLQCTCTKKESGKSIKYWDMPNTIHNIKREKWIILWIPVGDISDSNFSSTINLDVPIRWWGVIVLSGGYQFISAWKCYHVALFCFYNLKHPSHISVVAVTYKLYVIAVSDQYVLKKLCFQVRGLSHTSQMWFTDVRKQQTTLDLNLHCDQCRTGVELPVMVFGGLSPLNAHEVEIKIRD